MIKNWDDSLQPIKRWEDMSFWERLTDKDPSRPPKTWKSRIFWSWPIHAMKTSDTRQYISVGKNCSWILSEGNHPYIQIRVSRHHAIRFIWNGIMWGWK